MSATDDTRIAEQLAARCYGASARVEPITAINNAVFRLRFADTTKILKLARTATPGSMLKELTMLDRLARHDIPAPVVEHRDPGGTVAGRPFFIMDSAGDRTVAVSMDPSEPQSRALFTEMGSVLARIHGIALPSGGDIQADRIVPRSQPEYVQRLYRMADALVAQRLLDAAEAAVFKSLAMPSMDGVALCHSDFHAVQCIVRDGRISAVVDWETAWAGNPAIDLAITHAYLDFYAPRALTACFIAGYAAVRRIEPGYEAEYLPVRMAQSLALMRVWLAQSRQNNVKRAAALYREYLQRLG